jgi:hypothetical protein
MLGELRLGPLYAARIVRVAEVRVNKIKPVQPVLSGWPFLLALVS